MKKLYFSTTSLPFSSDPLDYDSYIHHYAFTSVFSGLVSSQKIGEIKPAVAEKWVHSNDFMEWRFTIRKDLEYSNSDKIMINDVYLSFKRVTYLMKIKKSQSGLLEFLIGFDSINSISDKFEGIHVEGQDLVFKFDKPMPDMLQKVSFGFYSIAHPELYNKETGEWVDSKKVIASGPYDVIEWTAKSFILNLRKNISYINYENSVQEVVFVNLLEVKDSEDLKKLSIVVADNESLMVNESFKYVTSSVGINISYIRCYGCEKKDSPLANLKVRQWLRSKFYEHMKLSGAKTTTSFFPLILKGVNEVKTEENFEKPNFDKLKIVTHNYVKHLKIKENENKIATTEYIANAIYSLEEDRVELVLDIYNNSKKFTDFDLIAKSTGIEAADFMETAKFMFLSKHGIKLPDLTGDINKELLKENPDIQVINQELWNQAVIWPVRHYTNGFWVNKTHELNYDELNTNHPAIDFQFIRWN